MLSIWLLSINRIDWRSMIKHLILLQNTRKVKLFSADYMGQKNQGKVRLLTVSLRPRIWKGDSYMKVSIIVKNH